MYKIRVRQYGLDFDKANELVPHHDMIFRNEQSYRKAAREVAEKIREIRGNNYYCQVHVYKNLNHDGVYHYIKSYELRR